MPSKVDFQFFVDDSEFMERTPLTLAARPSLMAYLSITWLCGEVAVPGLLIGKLHILRISTILF